MFVPAISRAWTIAIIAGALLSFVAKVTLAYKTHGSTDVLIWEANLKKISEEGSLPLYRDGITLDRGAGARFWAEFNHPPLVLRLLSFWSRLAEVSRVPFQFWLRFTCAIADLASTALVARILIQSPIQIRPMVLLLTALAPASLLVSGFHGNTDPIVMMFVLLCVYLLEKRNAWFAGIAFAIAVNIKIQPIVYLPIFWFALDKSGRRLQFVTGAAIASTVVSLPIILQNPLLIWKHVFGYNPQSGIWGFSVLAAAFLSEVDLREYARIAKTVLLAILGLASIWMNFRQVRPPFLQCAFLAFLFLSLSPGFGVQYLVWLVPWTAILTIREAVAFHTISGVFLFSYYNRAAHGLPWYLADSVATPVWYGTVILLGLLCWLTVCFLVISIARRLEVHREVCRLRLKNADHPYIAYSDSRR